MTKKNIMNNFAKIVRNYEAIGRLGREIVNHKDLVRRAAPSKLDEEFQRQEERIQKFVNLTNTTNEAWKKNSYSVNEYWTGLS